MEFRDLKRQYSYLKDEMDASMQKVLADANFIQGKQVAELEKALADYTGMKHCVACQTNSSRLSMSRFLALCRRL